MGAAGIVSAQCGPLDAPPGSPFSVIASGNQLLADIYGNPVHGPVQGNLNFIVAQNGSMPCRMSMGLINYDLAISTAEFGTIHFQLDPLHTSIQATIIANQTASALPATATISAYLEAWISGYLFRSQEPVTLVSNNVRSFPSRCISRM